MGTALEKNLRLYFRYDPKTTRLLEDLDPNSLAFCRTADDELNLVDERKEGVPVFYHEQSGALKEARAWFRKIGAARHSLIFVYGVGLGYYYDALSIWLRSNPKNILVFLEDDLRVLRRLFETERGTRLLEDPQVFIHYFESNGEELESGFVPHLKALYEKIYRRDSYFTFSKIYHRQKPALCNMLRGYLHIAGIDTAIFFKELTGFDVFKNFYQNQIHLARSYHGQDLFQKFKGIPGIVCGAGPSLTEHIDQVRMLSDRALIIASGTGMNVLNKHGIIPHLGSGLDPTPAQGSRLMTNTAFETPFFYRNRFYYPAFHQLHGPKLFINGFNNYLFPEWFEQQLNITENVPIRPGISSTNFCLYLLSELGCDPIVLVGVDLGYTQSKRYASGVTAHPTDKVNVRNQLAEKEKQHIIQKDNSGGTIKTKTEWLLEARLIKTLQNEIAPRRIINVSEKGMAIEEIPFETFSDVIARDFTRQYDIDSWLHCTIQEGRRDEVTEKRVLDVYDRWIASLRRCLELYEQALQGDLTPSKTALIEAELLEEPAENTLLSQFAKVPALLSAKNRNTLQRFGDQLPEKDRELLKKEIQKTFYSYYRYLLKSHLAMAEEARQSYHSITLGKSVAAPPDGCYVFKDGRLVIDDSDLDIHLEDDYCPQALPEKHEKKVRERCVQKEGILDGQCIQYFPDGTIKAEMFYKNGLLHGPVSYFSSRGQLIARSWFFNGVRQGRMHWYYPSGSLYSIQRFKNGKRHGRQEYFYEDGTKKSIIPYSTDILNGTVLLYHPNGKPKRQLTFDHGILEGLEESWNSHGLKILEAEYKHGHAVGIARNWHDNGQLAKQVIFGSSSENFNLTEWDEEGREILKECGRSANYPDKEAIIKAIELETQQMEKLKQNMGDLFD